MRRVPLLLAAVLLAFACDQPQTREARRVRAASIPKSFDSTIPPDRVIPFTVPESWDTVRLASGATYRQPRGFALGLNDNMVGGCNRQTLPVDSAILHTDLSNRWPLTVAMRRGDLNHMARVNGFVLDTTLVSTIGQRDNSTRVRQGEGWILVSGRTWVRDAPVMVLFGAIRYPGDCYLGLAARGVEINVDTLGYVLGTVRFPEPPPDSSRQ